MSIRTIYICDESLIENVVVIAYRGKCEKEGGGRRGAYYAW